MAKKMRKPDYWPALREEEMKAQEQLTADAARRSRFQSDDCIRIRGAREHNLKGLSLEIPRNQLVVLTGLSGSGKSSLAFDTIYAEGQRRYMESLSSYARQFLGQMEKPDVDMIEGLSPAISIDQKSTNRNPRSTVGTVTEIYDHLRLLYARIGIPHCPNCGREIARQSVDQMVDRVMLLPEGSRIQVLAPVVRGKKGRHEKVLERAQRAGYVRVRVDGSLYDLSEEITLDKNIKHSIEIVVDRLVIREGIERRLTDSIENALGRAEGLLLIDVQGGESLQFRTAASASLRSSREAFPSIIRSAPARTARASVTRWSSTRNSSFPILLCPSTRAPSRCSGGRAACRRGASPTRCCGRSATSSASASTRLTRSTRRRSAT